jgi:hypothetical protein
MFALKRSISLSHDERREHLAALAPHQIGRDAPFLSAVRTPPGPALGTLAAGSRAAGEALVHFAVQGPLRVATLAINRKNLPPKGDGVGVTLILDDFPVTGESIEYELGRIAADSHASVRLANEKLRHMVIDRGLAGRGDPGSAHERKPHRVRPLGDHQGVGMIIREPVRKNLVLVRIARTEYREQPGVQVRQGVEILRIDLLDPLAILLGVPAVANADEQGSRFPA